MQDGAEPPPPDRRLIETVSARYAGASRFTRGYVGSKLRRDPSTAAILALAHRAGGLGHVADLGCGRGQLALALLLSGAASRVTGLDYEAAKVAEARAASVGLAAGFEQADLTAAAVPDCDTALMVDVLYQLPEAAQGPLLDRMAAAARRRVVLRLFDPDRGWRSALGLAMERAGRAIRQDGAAVRPMPVTEVAARLAAAGFRSTVSPCWAGTPLPNVLLVAERSD
ncbi:methyltransferase domain-containing protein [Muricoccus aerilatus]|uniref:methyltransferase domain-containing protein n=1 Tax=Muricoccus aerilatus TaxID=452982 RepID=UPI0012EB7E62|nr:class I SAM-dependent methyltransferase [Roseomonas aerilata]